MFVIANSSKLLNQIYKNFKKIADTSFKKNGNYSKERYLSDVAETLQRNFYVDDLLKSVSDVATAIRLLNDVIEMWAGRTGRKS